MSFLVYFFLLFWHFKANCQGVVLNEVQGLGFLKKLIPQPATPNPTPKTPIYIPPITTQKPVEITTAIPSPTTKPPPTDASTTTTTTPPTTPPTTTTTTEVPTTTTTTTAVPTVAPTETVSPPGDSTTTTTSTTTETTVSSNASAPVSPDVVIPPTEAAVPPITETAQPLPPATEPPVTAPPVPTVTDTTTAPVENNPFLYQGPHPDEKHKKHIILNKDGVVEDLDPPHLYGEADTEKTPNMELRPYQEITTSDKWSIDPKDFAAGIDAAVEAHEAHVQGSAMLKAQCKSKLCNFPHD